jgi:hypothetical protein
LFGASEESQNAVIEEANKNNSLREVIPRSPRDAQEEPRGEPTQPLPLPSIVISPPESPPHAERPLPPKSREKALNLSPLSRTKDTSRRRTMEAKKVARDTVIHTKRIAGPLMSSGDSSSGSAKMTDQEDHYVKMLLEFKKSSDTVTKILENKETIIRSSARGERNRLINNWNDYCDSVHQYLEAMAEDDGPQATYDTTYNLFTEHKVMFEGMYKDPNRRSGNLARGLFQPRLDTKVRFDT